MHFHTWFLGMRRAMEMMMTGDSISGVEAVAEGGRIGLFADSLKMKC